MDEIHVSICQDPHNLDNKARNLFNTASVSQVSYGALIVVTSASVVTTCDMDPVIAEMAQMGGVHGSSPDNGTGEECSNGQR